jgi:hypothetical protein
MAGASRIRRRYRVHRASRAPSIEGSERTAERAAFGSPFLYAAMTLPMGMTISRLDPNSFVFANEKNSCTQAQKPSHNAN